MLQPWGSLGIPLPVIVSSRSNWTLSGSALEIFGEAYVLDGACRVESQLSEGPDLDVTIVAVLGLTEDDELDIRQSLFQQTGAIGAPEQKCGTDTPRVKLTTAWNTFTFASEPFVVPTSRGYAPAILVKRKAATQHEHILIGARSLAQPIEELRIARGTLEGATVQIHKSGEADTAPYELIVAE